MLARDARQPVHCHRAMERRPAPRAARADHRRERRLLRRLRRRRRWPSWGARWRRASPIRASPRPSRRQAARRARAPACRPRHSSRFCRTTTRSATAPSATACTAIAMPEASARTPRSICCCPQIPLLFMGEEWGAQQPFPFFCDFGGELADAVREGRRRSSRISRSSEDEVCARIPDPRRRHLRLGAHAGTSGRGAACRWLDWYRACCVAPAEIVPRLAGVGGNAARSFGDEAVVVRWRLWRRRGADTGRRISGGAGGFRPLSAAYSGGKATPTASAPGRCVVDALMCIRHYQKLAMSFKALHGIGFVSKKRRI